MKSRRSTASLAPKPIGQRAAGRGKENSSASTKIELRRWLVGELGGAPRILDCFCAAGEMWRRAYDAPGPDPYLGLDKEQYDDARATIVCDSRRFLRHVDVDLGAWDLFDLDAFGTPLEHLAIICERLRPAAGRRVGFALTDGTGWNAKLNSVNGGALEFLGLRRHRGGKVHMQHRDAIFEAAVKKCLLMAGLRRVEAREAKKEGGAGMRYAALLCERA